MEKNTRGLLGAAWGLLGVIALLAWAISRVLPHALDAFVDGLSFFQLLLLIVWCVYMVYSEGYRGFQKGFSPFVVSRATQLYRNSTLVEKLLAPLFCMGYFAASKKRMITSYAVTIGIIMLVIIVHRLPQPWRGMLDWGVVLGLTYGAVSLLVLSFQKFAKLQR